MADIYGNSSLDDVLSGTEEGDSLYGYEYGFTGDSYDGSDTLNGGAGNDLLTGGSGPDVLTGGSGSDKFVFSNGSITVHDELVGGGYYVDGEDGFDIITDFNPNEDSILGHVGQVGIYAIYTLVAGVPLQPPPLLPVYDHVTIGDTIFVIDNSILDNDLIAVVTQFQPDLNISAIEQPLF